MPIKYKKPGSDIFSSRADVLVNPVNTVGVMGKGLAFEFKKRYKENYDQYRKYCKEGKFEIGQGNKGLFIWEGYKDKSSKEKIIIINFPTKKHWRSKSNIGDIDNGLRQLEKEIKKRGIKKIAIPALGVGYGGKDWNEIKGLINEHLGKLACEIIVYKPHQTPTVKSNKKSKQEGSTQLSLPI